MGGREGQKGEVEEEMEEVEKMEMEEKGRGWKRGKGERDRHMECDQNYIHLGVQVTEVGV